MHPLLRSSKQFLMVGLLWSPICLWVIVIHKSLTNVRWTVSALLVIPPMAVKLFICLSAWYICKVVRVNRRNPFRFLSIHVLSSTIINAVWLFFILVYSKMLEVIFKTGTWVDIFIESVPIFLGVGYSLYFISILAYYLVLANEQIRSAEREVLKQQLLTSEAELKALKASIHPHFLFNGLNVVGPLIGKSPQRARAFISRLSDFLLYSLRYGKKTQVTVQDELDHITNYLAIEGERLGERLKVDLNVDSAVLRCPVLPLTLLPLVENSIKHGIGPRLEGGMLGISITADSGYLLAEVKNPYEKGARSVTGEGMGLDTLKRRIDVYYGPSGKITVDRDESMFKVRLRIPLKREAKNGR